MPKSPRHPALKMLGRQIRTHRERRRLSQEALADEARIDRSYMSGIERGMRNVSVLVIIKIAKALGVSAATLLEND